jgi:hypothetical protein
VLDGAKKRRLDNEGVGKNLQTHGDFMENISLYKKIMPSQLEVTVVELQETMNKMAKFENMVKCMGFAFSQLVCRETHYGERT